MDSLMLCETNLGGGRMGGVGWGWGGRETRGRDWNADSSSAGFVTLD